LEKRNLNLETELEQVRRVAEEEARRRMEVERDYQELKEEMARLQMMKK